MNPNTIILGVIGADCHSAGDPILEMLFSDQGFEVINLGVRVSQQECIDAALEHDAAAILVSSLCGHGEIDCDGFRARCITNNLDDIILYVGGNLVVGQCDPAETETKFKRMGFDRVFGNDVDVDLDAAAALLRDDIELLVGRQRERQVIEKIEFKTMVH